MADPADSPPPAAPEGTTDWESVFETGFIPLIAQAHSPGALKECATLVIRKLFPRQDDHDEVEHFTSELAGIIPDGAPDDDLEAMRAGITALLREIKDERIRLAAAYVAAQRKGKGDGKERRGAKRRRRRQKGKERQGSTALPPWIGRTALVAAAAGVAVFIIVVSGGGDKLAPASDLVEQMKAAAEGGKRPAIHVYGGALRVQGGAVTAEGVPQKPCVNAAWTLARSGRVVINGAMPTRITASILAELCAKTGSEGDGAGRAEGATLTWIPGGG